VTVDPLAPLDQLLDPRGSTFTVPDGWQLDRGVFGGIVVGAMVRALELSAPDRPLRSLTAEILAPPQPGDAALELEVLRAGNAVTTSAVRLTQGGELHAHGVGVLGRDRTTDLDHTDLVAPELPAWRDLAPSTLVPAMAPRFSQHFEYWIVTAPPFAGKGTRPEVLGWVRPRRPGQRRDAALLAACIDAIYPGVFTVMKSPRPMATIAFTFQPRVQFEGLDPEAPLAYRSHMVTIDRGFCVELRELWGEDGRLLALNQQTFVVIK
jgi:acyl-CoA thioesterase